MPANLPANIMIHAHAFPKKGLQKTKVQICEQNLHKVYQTKSATAQCAHCTVVSEKASSARYERNLKKF